MQSVYDDVVDDDDEDGAMRWLEGRRGTKPICEYMYVVECVLLGMCMIAKGGVGSLPQSSVLYIYMRTLDNLYIRII